MCPLCRCTVTLWFNTNLTNFYLVMFIFDISNIPFLKNLMIYLIADTINEQVVKNIPNIDRPV